ncbi:MAG: hypothetical protein QOK19_1455 [Solirubrobacteraceae bacterium]|nr:hypothetical protein [Solirubrobacteraceae bacterium]
MSRQAPLDTGELPASEHQLYEARTASLRARRVAAARVRRRRLLLVDLGAGTGLALFGFIAAPGLAILAVAALAVLAGCAGWIGAERLHERRARSGGRSLLGRVRRASGRRPTAQGPAVRRDDR